MRVSLSCVRCVLQLYHSFDRSPDNRAPLFRVAATVCSSATPTTILTIRVRPPRSHSSPPSNLTPQNRASSTSFSTCWSTVCDASCCSRCQSCRCLLAPHGTESMSGLPSFMVATSICHSRFWLQCRHARLRCLPTSWPAGGLVTDRVSWHRVLVIERMITIHVAAVEGAAGTIRPNGGQVAVDQKWEDGNFPLDFPNGKFETVSATCSH